MSLKNLMIVFVIAFAIEVVSANTIDIQIGNEYDPGEEVKFMISIYDGDGEKINEDSSYVVQDYYTDVIYEDILRPNEEGMFVLPVDSTQGLWKITASYGSDKVERLFTVSELEKIKIELDSDNLRLSNVGNVPYQRRLSIFIGEKHETALVNLAIGEIKNIHLTGDGVYDIKVSDGNEVNDVVFEQVSLTGNVIGISKSSEGFFKEYPLVSLFLAVVLLVTGVVFIIKVKKAYLG